MRQITVTYHHEGATWWAESDDLPGFSAAADSLAELQDDVRGGIAFHLDGEPVSLRMIDESGAALDAASAFAGPRRSWWSPSSAAATGVASIMGRSGQALTAPAYV